MDNDDAGINIENFETTTDYVENHIIGSATEEKSNAPIETTEGSVFATFSNMKLDGNIYNSSGWEASKEADSLAGAGDYTNEVGGGASDATDLSIVLSNVELNGSISTTEAYHKMSVISHKDYDQIGEVTNKVVVPENAGIVVKLTNNSKWNVAETCYVTSLTVDETSSVECSKIYVNGKEEILEKNRTYSGVIKLAVNER